jgi:SAM-dependent methyltransferase
MATETFQISAEQAEIYEARFVPAIFAQWAEPVLDLAGVTAGDRVLDVGCGTGVLARAAAARVRPTGAVTGVDLNDGMLSVARRLGPGIDWRQGDASALPIADGCFDVVACQSALMFFPDATAALREMARVCTGTGTVVVQVYARLADQPAYGPWVETVARLAGPQAVNLLGTYWVHGDVDALTRRFETAGLRVTDVRSPLGVARFASVREFVRTEIAATPLVDRITDRDEQRIIDASEKVLARYGSLSGLDLPLAAHLVAAKRK